MQKPFLLLSVKRKHQSEKQYMETERTANIGLVELSASAYEVTPGQADIIGWSVVDESGAKKGTVRDLLIDPEQEAVRYIIVDLDGTFFTAVEKAVLIPIGYAELGTTKEEVVIPVMEQLQYEKMPAYVGGEVTRDTEMKIRTAIGSPAALRIQEEIVEMDLPEFYTHHHFDRGNIVSRKAAAINEKSVPVHGINESTDDTIHKLVSHSEFNLPLSNADEAISTNAHNGFGLGIQGRELWVEPQENGTYRIMENERKVGVIYPEPGDGVVEWRTMDALDGRLVQALGEAITERNSI
ncbi:MAG: PRC-barrel domain containing protein [Flavobacteriales bacterium]|nr:MAG: PRC-barrel domain containing protein [Flavobacteriales bacterium]